MAQKQKLRPYLVVTAGDMSTASITSLPTNVEGVDNIAYQAIFATTAVGAFTVQVSLDYQPGKSPESEPINAGHWNTITPSGSATGSNTSSYIEINQCAAPWIRLVYTRTSGTGSLNAFITAKSI